MGRTNEGGRKQRLQAADTLLDSAVKGDALNLSDIFYAVLALKLVVNDLNEEIEAEKLAPEAED